MTDLVSDVPRPPSKVVERVEAIEAWAQKTFDDEPFTKLVGAILFGAMLFYKAEAGQNPKVNSFADALVYTSTCASVGYGDIFAVTPMGKWIGSAIMTIGPAMANAAFLGGKLAREVERSAAEDTQRQILATLSEILSELRDR